MVSAIITTYKRPPEIVKRAAESVLNQTFKDIELLIIDDSPSSYELREAVKTMASSLGERVRYIQHEENRGACVARNTGLKNANGEFIAFLDDDDEWLPEKIEKQLNIITKNDDLALVYCGRYTHYTSEQRTVEQKVKFYRGNIYGKLILDNFIGSTSFPLIRKSVLEQLGGFDINMKAAQDIELWLRIAKRHIVDYVEEPLVCYYVHEGEQITKNHRNKVDALEKLNEINVDYLKRHPKAHSIRILRILPYYAEFDLSKARKLFFEAVKLYPVPMTDMMKAFKWVYIMPLLKNKKRS